VFTTPKSCVPVTARERSTCTGSLVTSSLALCLPTLGQLPRSALRATRVL
jgi:hypothetical protein